ncbi:MAG: type II toxin-antitoxin system RelE/ParE family toxin [Tagaea sp.]|nr:type II toxin-antitoxin system RelE/ParE family toxin [Tagaea sp.]
MLIGRPIHKGLRRFVERDDPAGLPAAAVEKLRRMLSFLQDMASEDELRSVPGWGAHTLTGGRKGVWSLSVTRNWRLTFGIDRTNGTIVDLNLEDYH